MWLENSRINWFSSIWNKQKCAKSGIGRCVRINMNGNGQKSPLNTDCHYYYCAGNRKRNIQLKIQIFIEIYKICYTRTHHWNCIFYETETAAYEINENLVVSTCLCIYDAIWKQLKMFQYSVWMQNDRDCSLCNSFKFTWLHCGFPIMLLPIE